MTPVDELMRRAVEDGVFPGAVLLVSHNRQIAWHRAYGVTDLETARRVTPATYYDLASLTKALATTPTVLKLISEGAFGLASRLGDIFPEFARTDKAAIQVQHLLYHTSGLPDWKPYYRLLADLPPAERGAGLLDCLVREPLIDRTGEVCRYSDLGFMILQLLVELHAGQRLDRLVSGHFYQPLGIQELIFAPIGGPLPRWDVAATEKCPWRNRVLSGEVHDENAYALGGIAGQSGLFGTAAAVHHLLTALVDMHSGDAGVQLLPAELLRQAFARCPACQRGLGFDCPDRVGSSSGSRFSPESVGHLGYTGTSFWVDLKRRIVVILLSNRIHPSRANDAIKPFRPLLHDTIMSALLD
jgi:CubicO group peptidase (beta-lactamase class C family)